MAEGTLIELDGVKTYLVDSGGSSLALLLIHGSGPGIDGAWSWTPVLPELNKRYRTIAVDSPGYGESERRMREFEPLHFYHVEDAERFERKVRGLPMPVMVIAGREDETGPWNKSLPLVEMVHDVEFHVLPFCGHMPQYDQPHALVALLSDFLARKGAPAAAPAPAG